MHKLLSAISVLESACLSKDSTRTTMKEMRANGRDETRRYYDWLRSQEQITAIGCPNFDDCWK